MKKTLLALFATAAFLALPAQADTDFGVKAGFLSVEDGDSAATQAGVVASWDLFGMFGVEGEFNTSITDGETGGGFDYSANQLGAYAVLMTPGPMYFKAKAGLVRTSGDIEGQDFSDTQSAIGIGFGFTFFEIEWTRTKVKDTVGTDPFDSDVDLLSVNFKF